MDSLIMRLNYTKLWGYLPSCSLYIPCVGWLKSGKKSYPWIQGARTYGYIASPYLMEKELILMEPPKEWA
ncbi:MAG: hypothetical protein AAF694_13045 [Bacteroidota bacterium]